MTEVKIGGVSRSTSSYDVLGRINGYIEKTAAGAVVYERFGFTYNSSGQVLAEKSRQLQGADWYYSHTTNYYNDTGFITGTTTTPGAITGSTSVGSSTGMQLYYTQTKNWKNGTVVGGTGVPAYGGANDTAADDSSLKNSVAYSEKYGWQQTQQQYVNKYGTGTSTWTYGLDGAIRGVARGVVSSTTPYPDFYYFTDANGYIVEQWQAVDNGAPTSATTPKTHTYRFGGKEMGVVTNNSTTNTDYATLIDRRDNAPGTGNFLGGATTGTPYASFDANHITLAGGAQDDTPGSWTVKTGDTLQGIALAIWGDANLWYKIAQANGVADAGLAEGQTLVIPGGVGNIRNNADTIKPYDPLRAMGDVAPPQATPQPPKKHGCGILGMLLIAAIGIAVTVATAGAGIALATGQSFASGLSTVLGTSVLGGSVLTASAAGMSSLGFAAAVVGAGMVGGAVGSAASQGAAVAMGMQDSFSWKGVALGAVGGGVSAGLGVGGLFENGAFSGLGGVAGAGLRAATSSAITQGIAVATHLQDSFNWAGVAAAGVSGAAGNWAGGLAHGIGGIALGSAASLVTGAATRSAIEGTSFGDNIRAALPDTIAQVLSGALTQAIKNPHIDPLQVALDDSVSDGSTGHSEDQATENIATITQTPVKDRAVSKGQKIEVLTASVDTPSVTGDLPPVPIPIGEPSTTEADLWSRWEYYRDQRTSWEPGQYDDPGAIAGFVANLDRLSADSVSTLFLDLDGTDTRTSSYDWSELRSLNTLLNGDGVMQPGVENGSGLDIMGQPLSGASNYNAFDQLGNILHKSWDVSLGTTISRLVQWGTYTVPDADRINAKIFDPYRGMTPEGRANAIHIDKLTNGNFSSLGYAISTELGASQRTSNAVYNFGRSVDGFAISAAALSGGSIQPFTGQSELNIWNAQVRNVPNPYGKLGGPEHRAEVKALVMDIGTRGFRADTEFFVSTPNGEKSGRYIDVVAIDGAGRIVESYQVGQQTKAGNPVARELRAINDITTARPDLTPAFVPYNASGN